MIWALYYQFFLQNGKLKTIDLRLPVSYQNGCHLNSSSYIPLPCYFGDSQETIKVYLFGDSHAAQWVPALERAGSLNHFQGRFITKSSCPYVHLGLDEDCNKWQETALQQVIKEKPNLLILASLTNEPYIKTLNKNQYASQWIFGLQSIIEKLPSKTRIMIINDSPYLSTDPIPCLAKQPVSECKFESRSSFTTVKIREFSNLHDLSFENFTLNICKQNICSTGNKKINYFRDEHHLSYIFSQRVGSTLAKSISNLLGNQ